MSKKPDWWSECPHFKDWSCNERVLARRVWAMASDAIYNDYEQHLRDLARDNYLESSDREQLTVCIRDLIFAARLLREIEDMSPVIDCHAFGNLSDPNEPDRDAGRISD